MSLFIVATIAIVIIIVLFYLAGWATGMWRGPIGLFKRDRTIYEFPEMAVDIGIDDRYLPTIPGTMVTFRNDGTVEFDGPDNYHFSQKAVEIADPMTDEEYDRAKFRAENPRLFRDDWYETWRTDFNEWVADMRAERMRERVNMAYAT
jgi:hypothetical protein